MRSTLPALQSLIIRLNSSRSPNDEIILQYYYGFDECARNRSVFRGVCSFAFLVLRVSAPFSFSDEKSLLARFTSKVALMFEREILPLPRLYGIIFLYKGYIFLMLGNGTDFYTAFVAKLTAQKFSIYCTDGVKAFRPNNDHLFVHMG